MVTLLTCGCLFSCPNLEQPQLFDYNFNHKDKIVMRLFPSTNFFSFVCNGWLGLNVYQALILTALTDVSH